MRTGSPIHTEDVRSSAAPPTVKDRFSNSHRKLSSQRCSTNCQGQALPFTPKTFAPALLHRLSRTGSPIHTEDFRSSAAPPTVKDRISNSHRRLSFQRCSTNCQGQVLQFTPKTFVPPTVPPDFQAAPIHTEDFRQADQLSRTGSPIHTEDFRSSAAPPTVKDRISNSHRRLSFQRCSSQGQDLQFTPKTFVPALLHQLSRTGSPIHTELSSHAAPPTVKDRYSNSHRRLSLQRSPPTVKDRFSNSKTFTSAAAPTVEDRFPIHTEDSERCSTNCQGQVLQFTPKTFVPALLHQLSRTGSPIHIEDFRCSAAPPTVKDRISNSHRRLSIPALLHQMSRTGSPIHTEDFRSSAAQPTVKDRISNSHRRLSFPRCSTNCQGQVLQFTPKTFAPALLHRSPIHTEDFRSNAAPETVKDRFSNSHRRLSFQRCFTNCQGQVLQFTPKTFRSSAAPPTVKDRFSNSHQRLSFCSPPTVKDSISN